MQKQRPNMSVLQSTIGWIAQVFQRFDNHETMIKIFEENYDQSNDIDPNLEPVCILSFDGGGLRGMMCTI